MSLIAPDQRKDVLRFFFAPTHGYSVALFRIVFALIALYNSIFNLFNLERFYSDTGMVPYRLVASGSDQIYSVLSLAPKSDEFLFGLGYTMIAASFFMLIGMGARFSALLLWVGQIAFQHRDPYVVNGGDRVFLILAGLSVLLPLSRKWSVKAWWQARRRANLTEKGPIRFPMVWAQRLVCLQICYIYLFAFGAKVGQPHWLNGTALGPVLASPRLAEWPMVIDFYPIIALFSWATLVFEFSFPIFVWREEFRRKVLLAGFLFHAGIDVLLVIPMFTPVMVASYALFLRDDEVKQSLDWFLRKLRLRAA